MAKKIGKMEGGAGISIGHTNVNQSSLYELFIALRAELDDLRTKYDTVLAKIDTDFTAQNAAVAGSQLDVDYQSTGALSDAEFEA